MGCSRKDGAEEGADLDSSKIYIPKSARLAIIDWFHVARCVCSAAGGSSGLPAGACTPHVATSGALSLLALSRDGVHRGPARN